MAAGRNSSRAPQRIAGDAVSGMGRAATHSAARTREEAEDLLAEARAVARGPHGRDAAVYAGLGAATVAGAVAWPIAALAGAGYAVVKRAR
ncbi:MAG: hypothetical protein NVSMB25_02690 [Thermoleophilaceae bacterium]